ncbi:MAG: phosphoribosylamine--glycine ligase [Candidatus Omnitrophota bacterium]|nr:phosphoribosylamine--glycine ligase [Candidatus Omnitrophota bacterium]
MKVLIIGSGGREHAIVWKLAQSKKIDKLFCAPGNGGIAEICACVDINVDDIPGLLKFAKDNKIDLTVVGPEAPLVKGIVDEFEKNSLKIFGPSKFAAQLEGSKVFAKEFLAANKIPTADFKVFDNAASAQEFIKTKKFPLVIKADGLAAGKGVVICKNKEEAEEAIDSMIERKIFGEAGERIIIEDCLVGEEASMLAICNGENFACLASAQDHKRIFDNDEGPNTGGMGAYSPAPVVTEDLQKKVEKEVFAPTIAGMKMLGHPFKGILYAGLMITKDGPKVLEFNVRFGDPETQAILPRMKNDLLEAMLASIDGKLEKIKLGWVDKSCVCVVIASGGYPGEYEKDKEISGLDEVRKIKDTMVFHAGTKKSADKILTNGGRVLGVTGLGKTIKEAIDKAYQAMKKIKFEGMHFRKDIGYRAMTNFKAQNPK